MMKRFLALFVSLALVLITIQLGSAQRNQRVRWAPDGKHLLIGTKWLDPLTNEEVEKIPVDTGKKTVNPATEFRKALTRALKGKRVPRTLFRRQRGRSTLPRAPERRQGMLTAKGGTRAVLVHEGNLWAWSSGKKARRVRDGMAGIRRMELAPDGRAVSYIKDMNLFITGVDGGKTRQVTRDGSEVLFYGELDWVYQEEVYGRFNFKGTWWSPDGRHLAFLRTDEEGVDTFMVVDFIPDQTKVIPLKYPKAGRTNPRATLHVVRAKDGKTMAVDLSKYKTEDEILIVRVGWTPEGDRVVFKVQNREQTWLDLNFADPATGKVKTIIHESSEDSWVNFLAKPRWLKDGSFLWESERTGFKHIYRYDRSGRLLATLTSGDWEVRNVVRLDEKKGHITFYATKESAIGLHAYRVGLDGSGFTQLTRERGTHRISLNKAGTLLIDSFSSLDNPGEVWLRKADGTDVRKIRKTPVRGNPNLPELVKVKARDGEMLDVTIQKPNDFDPGESYPVWINTYSGPNAPSVRDRWQGSGGSRGSVILLRINVRSASGRGMKYTKRCYRQFGVQELKDIEDVVKWLTTEHEWADASRVGIEGVSYGGYMAAYALTHSKMFKVGIAHSGVYDWRLYDTIYTERYMAKPQNNKKGYRVSSVVKAARNLHGHLVIVHGGMDDNVHMQNALQLAHALQNANKQNFTLMIYPKAKHGVRNRHWTDLKRRIIKEHL